MKKTSQAVKRQLKEQWEKACNAYLEELLRMWELDKYYAYWIGDEVGGLLDYGCGMFTISMEDIIYCVENGVEETEVMQWQEYIVDASEFGFTTPNLRSWHNGCPRTSANTFEKLRGLKNELNKAVDEEKRRSNTTGGKQP